jgi:uncharacterized protein (DUF2236 family)
VPRAAIPASLGDFREYVRACLAGCDIRVTPAAREIAGVILDAPLPAPLRLLAPAHRLSTAAFLPERIRAEYGLRFGSADGLRLGVWARAIKVAAVPALLAAERLSPPGLELAA